MIRRPRQSGVLALVIGIPAAAVIMGLITLYLAFSYPDPAIRTEQQALSRTSWQAEP